MLWPFDLISASYWHFIYYYLVPANSETHSVWKLVLDNVQTPSNVSFGMLLNDGQLLRVYVSWWMNEWMNVEHGWNDTDRRKRKQPEKNLSHCHSVHHKAHADWPWNEPGLWSEKPVANHLSHGMVPITLSSSDLISTCHEFFSNKIYMLQYMNIQNLFFLFTLFLCRNFLIMTIQEH